MTPYFLLCAEKASRTTEGTIVLHGVIERLFVKDEPTAEKPFTIPTMSIVFELRDADIANPHAVRVQLMHRETKTSLFDHTMRVEPSKDPSNKITGLLNFHLLPIKAFGAYEMSVEVDGTFVAANSFFVVPAPAM
ncbi:hypothetical protein KBB27_04425 [Patescibacteria group bacterium]|nr:hypothetical protein [Patescibacteria group bacterium]